MKIAIICSIMIVLFSSLSMGQEQPLGTIKGVVIDKDSREPLLGANVALKGTQKGAATSSSGTFLIERVPVGNYTLLFSYIGYEVLAKADVIVRPQRITFVDAELVLSSIEVDGIVVTPEFFPDAKIQPTSSIGFSGEEIRRAPGSAGDVSRIVYGLPSVSKVSDTKNSLIVRGGGPTENGFYIDNIEIPNINHFPEQGSSGGPIGLVNVDFIKDVNFHTGGFSALYGDRLSSIMDLSFRKGNTEELDGQVSMDFTGFGAQAEGPMAGGSWLVSARRSFLDIIVGAIGEDQSSVPQYSDYQGKLYFDISQKHKLSVINLLSLDNIGLSGSDAIKNQSNFYHDYRFWSNTIGANWIYLWSANGYSETSLSNTTNSYDSRGYETRSLIETGEGQLVFRMKPLESETRLRNINHYRVSSGHALDFGVEVKYIDVDNDNFYGVYNDDLGHPTAEYRVDDHIRAAKLFGFVSYEYRPLQKLTITPGVRVGYFTYNKNSTVSPRVSMNYQATPTFSVNASAGVFHQYLPLPLLTQNAASKQLKDPVAYHYVLGFHKLLSEDTRLTLEAYAKEYDRFPLDPIQPQLFIIDQVVQSSMFYNNHALVDGGKAYTRGVEVTVQKKLATKLYGLLSASVFRSRYRDYNGVWRDRAFDNRFTFQVEGGYKPNNKWEFSARWLFAGGRPYTPFDEVASSEARRGVLDVNHINGERLSDYHSLNLRVDRRFHYSGSNLIFYLSVWNAYGRKNLDNYVWNEVSNQKEENTQWGTLPVFGLEYEF